MKITVNGIAQDEPIGDNGNSCPDATGIGRGTARVRAEREGGGDGRVYHIAFLAENGGGQCNGTVTVCVPKSQKPGTSCIDEGPHFDSTAGTCTGAECDDACTIEVSASSACVEEKLPLALSLRIERARFLLARAAEANTAKRQRRLTASALKRLKKAAFIAPRLQLNGKISSDCVRALAQMADQAEARLTHWIKTP